MVMTNGTGDFNKSTVVTDKDGNTVSSSEQSKEPASDGTVTEKSKVLLDGTTTEDMLVTNPDGVDRKSVSKDSFGNPTNISLWNGVRGAEISSQNYNIQNGNAFVSKIETIGTDLVIPTEIEDFDGNKILVVKLKQDSIQGGDRVDVPDSITKIDTGAFNQSTATVVQIGGTITKKRIGKNALRPGTANTKLIATEKGKKKPGKGITIIVEDKKAVKAMKKLLKRAGIPGAEVTKQGYRMR